MFRIRRVYDDTLPEDRRLVRQVLGILRDQFPLLDPGDIDKIPDQLANPLKYRFRSVLFVADEGGGKVKGFALVLHAPDLRFVYLDFISTGTDRTGRGVGSALYERVRDMARDVRAVGLFFECLPDDSALCADPSVLSQNAARLRFYERYGARPIANTAYETPVRPGADPCPPLLVFDDLGSGKPLGRATARKIVRAILERKYAGVCDRDYVDAVVASFRDDPVRLRPPRYAAPSPRAAAVEPMPSLERRILLTVNERHRIHHVRERGYVESPVRVDAILGRILPTGLFERVEPRHFADRYLEAVHDRDFVSYLKRVCLRVPPQKSVYPYVFPLRNQTRPPKELPIRAGYYCMDTFTPLNENAYAAARGAVDCALTAADGLLHGRRLAYALVRPPGHHAETRAFGGFCYFNSAAVAAHYLSAVGRVAVLDVDYHHGNGTQSIFYRRGDVFTASIHGHPRFAYPYFTGFADEKGEGEGTGANWNVPLPEQVDGPRYRGELDAVLTRVGRFRPQFLVLSLGLDTARGDPTGTWSLTARDFQANGEMVGRLGIPTVIVQEGGYRVRNLGTNARSFFLGLWKGAMTG